MKADQFEDPIFNLISIDLQTNLREMRYSFVSNNTVWQLFSLFDNYQLIVLMNFVTCLSLLKEAVTL